MRAKLFSGPKGTRRAFLLGGLTGLGLFYAWDYQYREQRVHRCFRTLVAACQTVWDYKVYYRFHPEELDEIHNRASKRIVELCRDNGGLYIKFGQGISSMNHVLPQSYRENFSSLYDQAPYVGYEQVEKIVRREFHGKTVDQLFQSFEKEPVASASIAQVHKATLKDGREVAVKVQKPSIRVQMKADLTCYRAFVYLFEKFFDLPMYWAVDYVVENIEKEANFITEAQNAEKTAMQLKHRTDLYIPKVYWDRTTEQVMTCEWIDGVKFNDAQAMKRGGFSQAEVAQTMAEVFAEQIFVTGFVHSDPHPGNILVRRKKLAFWDPRRLLTKPFEMVLLDHGLYVQEPENFRQQYCQLWRAIFMFDIRTMRRISKLWGIRDSELFVSIQLMKPFKENQKSVEALQLGLQLSREQVMEMQMEMKNRIKHLLEDTHLIPRALIFIGRNMNIIRANNKDLGSPVNRIKIMAGYAARGCSEQLGLLSYISFQSRLMAVSVAHNLSLFWSAISSLILGRRTKNLEDIIDDNMEDSVKHFFGLKINSQMND